MTQSSTYCSLPFRGMQIECDGELKPCCLYKPHLDKNIKQYHVSEYKTWWSEHLESLRATVLEDKMDPGCSYCFDPATKDHPMKTGADRMFNYSEETSATPEWLDIRFGNYCNLKCIMCSPLNSSQIEQEYNNNKSEYNQQQIFYNSDWKNFTSQDKPKDWWDDEASFWQVVEIVNRARYINFSGGEPLMMPALYTLLDAISPDCVVTFNTNLTKVSNRAIESFKKFRSVIISVSLDGAGVHHEYIRSGASWSEIDANIRKVCELDNVTVNFSYLLQHTSVYTWPAMWDYLKPFNRHIMVHPVYAGTIGDGILTQDSVATADMQKFAEWHSANSTPYDSEITNWINSYKFDPAKHQQYRDYVNMLDRVRGCDFVKTFNPSW